MTTIRPVLLWIAALVLAFDIPCCQSFSIRDSATSKASLLQQTSRRDVFLVPFGVSSSILIGTTSWPQPAVAADPNVMNTVNNLLTKLDGIPAYCIVDKTTGASYMLFKNDQAMAIGYAFTTFPGALAVLAEAQKTAKEKNYFDVWKDATITTIPLSIAVRLALKKRERTTPKEQTLDSLVMVIPGADERIDGIAVDSRFKDQGRVPLFYITDEQRDADDNAPVRLYFTRKDLLQYWNEKHPGERLPKVKALDLVGIFENTVRGRADEYLPSTHLEFVPPQDTLDTAKELKARGLAPYSATKMIM